MVHKHLLRDSIFQNRVDFSKLGYLKILVSELSLLDSTLILLLKLEEVNSKWFYMLLYSIELSPLFL